MAGRSRSSGTELVSSVKLALKSQAEANKAGPKQRPTIFRVPPELKQLGNYYTPQFISLGLFNRSDFARTRANKFRIEVVSAFLQTVKMTEQNWDKLCAEVVNNPHDTRELYDEDQDELSEEEIRTALTLDAVFLTCLLGSRRVRYFDAKFPFISILVHKQDTAFLCRLEHDALLLENQIPLYLLRNALLVLCRNVYAKEDFDDDAADVMWGELCVCLAPIGFSSVGFHNRMYSDDEQEHEHLLACIHHRLFGGRKAEKKSLRTEDSIYLPCVTKLCAAGIEFRGVQNGNIDDVKFLNTTWGLKAIVMLPMLDGIYDNTINLWKNLTAYEEGSNINGCKFMNYLEFMDDIIDTKNDMPFLMKGRHPVIRQNGLGDDEAAALLFNSMLKNHFILHISPTWVELRKNIIDFYQQKYRRLLYEALTIYFGKPWQTVSIVAGSTLLALTFLQTFYTMLPYYHHHM